MKQNKAHLLTVFLLLCIYSFGQKDRQEATVVTPNPHLTPISKVEIELDKSTRYQTIDGFGFFGAANVWWSRASAVWNDAWAEKAITDLGITIWRNEIFPPSTETVHQDADWEKIKPVVEGLKSKADKYHVKIKFIATVWSPPADMKWTAHMSWAGDQNATRGPGLVTTKNGGTLNPNKYTDYANWLKDNLDLYEKSGVSIYALSLQNELMFSQAFNSCVYTTNWYNEMVNAVVPEIKKRYPALKIFGSENMLDMEGKDKNWPNFYHSSILKNPITSKLIDILSVHGYTDGVSASSGSALAKMWSNHLEHIVQPMNKPVWMTETSGYIDDWEKKANKPGALNLAMDIYSALYFGNISAWVWWQGSGDDLRSEYTLMSGTAVGKRYYVSKHFYRYIRPGAVRIKTISSDPEVSVTAFMNQSKGTYTVIIINSGEAKILGIKAKGLPNSFKMYRTSSLSNENCSLIGNAKIGAQNNFEIPAKCILTLQAGGDAL